MEATADTAIYILCYMQAREQEANMVSMEFSLANICENFGMPEGKFDKLITGLVRCGLVVLTSPNHTHLTSDGRRFAASINDTKLRISTHL